MSRPEIEAKLIELAAEIERAQTAIWLAEFEREQLRNELRRLPRGESGKADAA